MIKYGLISETDARILEKTVDLICNEFDDNLLQIAEVGVYSGETGNGLQEYIDLKGRKTFLTGIDNSRDKEPIRFNYDIFYKRDSNEAYGLLLDDSMHLVIIDALHTFPAVISDFFCYASKVKVGGFIAFHDTGKHIDPFSQWQGVGYKNDVDFCLGGVRKALNEIRLLDPGVTGIESNQYGWELIFDEADENDKAGGFCVFKKLY